MTYLAVAGILPGLLAGFIMRQKKAGMIGFVLVGLAGSCAGGFFFGHHLSVTDSLFVNTLITSTTGAVVFILGIGIFKNTETRGRTA